MIMLFRCVRCFCRLAPKQANAVQSRSASGAVWPIANGLRGSLTIVCG